MRRWLLTPFLLPFLMAPLFTGCAESDPTPLLEEKARLNKETRRLQKRAMGLSILVRDYEKARDGTGEYLETKEAAEAVKAVGFKLEVGKDARALTLSGKGDAWPAIKLIAERAPALPVTAISFGEDGTRLSFWARLAAKSETKIDAKKPVEDKPGPETVGEGHEELRKVIKKARAELQRLQKVDAELDEVEARAAALDELIKNAKRKGRDIGTVATVLAPLFANHTEVRGAMLSVTGKSVRGKVSITNKKALALITDAGLEIKAKKRGKDKLANMPLSVRLPRR